VAGTITSLQQQKHDHERVSIFIDDTFAFGVSLDVAARLKKGQRLSDAEIEDLKHGDELERTYQKAVHYLGARPRSAAEVERHLRDKGCTDAAIAAALQRLIEQHYLDDSEFARFWLEDRSRFRPRSASALRYELRQKGLDRDTIEEALSSVDEDEAAWAAASTRLARLQGLPDDQFEQKLTAFLARRGFGYDIIRRTVRKASAARNENE
jgi:regulatory protein